MRKQHSVQWTRYFARKFCAQRFEILPRVFASDFFYREFGQRIKHNLIVPERGNQAIYYDKNEWPAFTQKVYAKVCKNLPSFNHYMKLVHRDELRFDRETKQCARGNLQKASWSNLKKRYVQFDRVHMQFFITSIWLPFITEPILAVDAESELKKVLIKAKLKKKAQHYFDILFSPEKNNAILQEREDLLSIAVELKMKGSRLQSELLKKHARKYEFLPCYDLNDKPWPISHFRNELKKLLRQSQTVLAKELSESKSKAHVRKKMFDEMLDELPVTKKQRFLFEMTHLMAFIKDERDDFRRRGSYNARPLFKEMARRAGVSLDAIAQLTRSEVVSFLDNKKLPLSKKRLNIRTKGYVLLRKDGGVIRVYEGKEAQDIMEQELGSSPSVFIDKLKGVVGSPGEASGPARIVITKRDLAKVKPGDIMVAVTTHPDFVPAMSRCAAIVTDEGGITSHASIVSRELGIPCIVGTESATHMLNDGNVVSVDASKGWVRKI